MNKLVFDKNKLKSASSECFDLAQSVADDINYVYDKILNLSNNNIWLGKDADMYINIRQKDRNEYEKFFLQFKNLLKDMNNIVEEVNNCSGNITIDKSIVNNINCQLDNVRNVMNDDLKNISTELNKIYSISTSINSRFRNYNISNLSNCNSMIKEVVDNNSEICDWIKNSTKYTNFIFDAIKDDVSKTQINPLNNINSIIRKI